MAAVGEAIGGADLHSTVSTNSESASLDSRDCPEDTNEYSKCLLFIHDFPVGYPLHNIYIYIYICEFKNWLCLTCLSCGNALRERERESRCRAVRKVTTVLCSKTHALREVHLWGHLVSKQRWAKNKTKKSQYIVTSLRTVLIYLLSWGHICVVDLLRPYLAVNGCVEK